MKKKIRHLIVLYPDHLSLSISSLKGFDPEQDHILLMEVEEEYTFVKHHKKKIVFVMSCMRHFKSTLEDKKYPHTYIQLTDKDSHFTYTETLSHFLEKHPVEKVIVTEPGDYRLIKEMKTWKHLEMREDTRFFITTSKFQERYRGKKHLLMEQFYREMRKETEILMKKGKPEGGEFNYDKENRESFKKVADPKAFHVKCDEVTKEVMALVSKKFKDHFGEIEPFFYATTEKDAEKALSYFISHHLTQFGPYQDMMQEGEPFLHHSVLSLYMNVGLLDPKKVVASAIDAYENGEALLPSVEGFIRQILGWREWIRGIYWLHMPDYKEMNHLGAHRRLPDFYWTGDCKMNCLHQVVEMTRIHAYSHHIQRLMVTGNFSLLMGVDPKEICEWYLIVYVDAFDWVELPNTLGMSQFADGGVFATKPYISSGNYINKMSNFCKGCDYDVKVRTGDKACPFNFLYWNFLMKHEKKFKDNPRIGFAYKHIANFTEKEKKEIKNQAENFIEEVTKPSRKKY